MKDNGPSQHISIWIMEAAAAGITERGIIDEEEESGNCNKGQDGRGIQD
jgi:hypothetical protein